MISFRKRSKRRSSRFTASALAALRRLPPHCQEVIVLCDVEELTYKEIASALVIPIGTVMSRLHRGRELNPGRAPLTRRSHEDVSRS